jgi:choline dehydrogenase-like flavoprotein
MKPSEYPSNGRDWEARFYGDYSPSPNIRARPEDYPINEDNSPIKVVNFNGVGGSTIMYTAHFPRMHPSDFRVRTLDGVADDWPIDYATLEPYFAENDRMMGVSGLAGDPAYPPKQPPMPPLPLGNPAAVRAMNQLGWHWWPSDPTIATTDYEGARAASISATARRLRGAKASTDITYWRSRARRRRLHDCRVRESWSIARHGLRRIYYDPRATSNSAAEVVISPATASARRGCC